MIWCKLSEEKPEMKRLIYFRLKTGRIKLGHYRDTYYNEPYFADILGNQSDAKDVTHWLYYKMPEFKEENA